MTKNSPLSMQVSKSYQILIFALICGVVFITAFFAILCVNENKAIEMRHLARIDYAGDAIKNAIQVANNVMYAYESRYDDGLIHILHDFNEKFIQVYGDLDQIHLDALKQEYEIIHPQGVVLYILDSKNTIIASTNPAEIGYNFSNIPEFAEELTQIYNAKWAVLDITSRNQQSGEMLKYGYISSYDHDYLLEAGIAVSDLFIPDDSRYTNLDPNIITTPNSVFLFSKSAVLEQNPDKGLLQLGGSEQTLPDFTKRVDYISRAFSEKSIFSIDNFEEKKRINYYFISYPAEDAPSHSFASQVLEVTADLTPLHDEIFRNTLILSIITIICDLVFISMILIIIRFVVYPINQIIDDIEIIANGNYDHKIKQTKGPEFDRLEISIAKMISAFQEQNITLLQKNSSLHALMEASVHGILTVDSHVHVHHFNTIFCDMWGLLEDEIYVGADGSDILVRCANQTIDPELFMSNIRTVFNSPDVFWNMHVYLSDGKIFQSASSPICGSDGTYYGRIWEVIDITERVQKEQELEAAYLNIEAQNEELLATEEALRHHNSLLKETESELIRQNSILVTLQEHLAGGFYVFSENKKIVSFNQKFLDLFGFSREELEQNRDLEYLLRACALYQDATEQRALIEELIHDRTSSSHDEVVLVDGTILERHSTPIIDKNGIYRGRLREFIDITEHVQKEQELEAAYLNIEAQNEELLATEEALRTQYSILQEKDNHLTLALEGTGKGLWTWDASTEQLTLNPAFTSRYRSLYREQSIDSFISAIHPDERELCLNILREIRKMDPDASIEFEFQLQSNEGMWRWIMSRGIVSEKDDDGVPMMITGTFVDITERRQHEKHLREVNRKMLMLSQITRHDIVNKLNNLFMISDGLSAELSDTPYDMVSIKNLLELMEYGLTTVMRQMEFSRDYQELGVHGAEWQDVAVCIENVRPFLIHPPVELVVDNLPMIFADPLLEKAVYNLFENSLRHGGDVSLIKVTFSADDYDNGILVFEDNGVGVLDKDKEKIFEKDFGKNTGLGLFLIREIFGLTEMTIRECGEPGHGARFEITIPAGYWRL